MIYYFNEKGECIQKASSVQTGRAIRDGRAIALHLKDLQAHGPVSYFISDHDYKIDQIYYDRGGLRVKQQCPAVLDGQTLSNLPVPCQLIIDNRCYTCEDSVTQLNFTYPGVYLVEVRAWPYLPKTFKVVV